uniref:Integrase catalytic domain-containing protein n=1 Tax=Amphimedon queenslandica TaxID=400682 RepID=A0A1X7TW18_AMPQE
MDMRSTKLVAVATRVGGLYQIQTHYIEGNTAATVDKEDQWHRNFGNLSSLNLHKLARDDLILKPKYPLDIALSDVCGKLNLSGAEFFTDSLMTKFDLFGSSILNDLQGRTLKVLGTDNGGEFTSEFEEYLRKGVKHELTIPKCPQKMELHRD